MDEEKRRKWENVYSQTNYIVFDGRNRIVVRIGENNAVLDELLKRCEAKEWAFLTAYNPFSEVSPEKVNRLRQMNLLKRLEEKGFRFLDGCGEDADKDWREPSVFIFGIERETAVKLGREFEQNAIVIGQIGTVAQLVWC